jgi:hypothetical protein
LSFGRDKLLVRVFSDDNITSEQLCLCKGRAAFGRPAS